MSSPPFGENINQDITIQVNNLPSLLQDAIEQQSKDSTVDITKIMQASEGIAKLEHGYHASVPMRCRGNECPMAKTCPLWSAGFTYMLDKQCPLEQHLLKTYQSKIQSILNIDPTNFLETGIAAEIAEIDIYQMRVSNRIGYEDFVKQQIVGISDDGDPMYREELHQAVIWKEMLSKRKLKLMDSLLATRKAVAVAGAGQSNDPSTQAAAIKRILEKSKINLNKTAEDLRAERAKPTNQ